MVGLIMKLRNPPSPGIKTLSEGHQEKRVQTVSGRTPASDAFTLPSVSSIIVDLKEFCLELWYTLFYLIFMR